MRLEKLIQAKYNELSQNELYIWNYILHHKLECENISIHGLAQHCNVSHTTIMRFVRKLGFHGYSEFKYYLRWSDKEEAFGADEIDTCYREYINNLDMIRDRDCSDMFELMDQARRVFVFGTGDLQKNIAREMKRTFSLVNKLMHVIEGYDEIRMASKYATADDLFILISLSGENKLMKNVISWLQEKNIKIVSFTKNKPNTLARASDVNISLTAHKVVTRHKEEDITVVAQFFMVTEVLFLKYLEYLE